MAKEKKLVSEITSRDEDFAQWFTDICLKAELVDYSTIKGFTIMRPYGSHNCLRALNCRRTASVCNREASFVAL